MSRELESFFAKCKVQAILVNFILALKKQLWRKKPISHHFGKISLLRRGLESRVIVKISYDLPLILE